jgi:hypothetical protein
MPKKQKPKLDQNAIGKTMSFQVPLRSEEPVAFLVLVKVLELRKKFGRTDVKITPVAGSGEAYVSANSLKETP